MLQTLTILLFGRPIGVQRLESDGYCAFQYTEDFCRTGIQPAPLQMPAHPERIFRFPGLGRETFQGKRCMGALEYQPARETYLSESSRIELQELIDTARQALASKESFQTCLRNREEAIIDILKIGTSAGGQRAKAVIALNDNTGEIRSGQVQAPEGFDYWNRKSTSLCNTSGKNPSDHARNPHPELSQ